jgi:protein O-GlcNAc transferase
MSTSALRKLQQAQEKLQNGDIESAAVMCEQVLQRLPRNPDALWLFGTIHILRGQPDAAVPVLEKALAAAPGHGSALEMLGLAHLMRGDHAAAERVLADALRIPGAPSSVRLRYALALLHQARHAEAIRELTRLAAVEPHNIDVHLNLGLAYAGTNNWSDAAAAFGRVLAAVPDHVDALYNLGVARLELQDRSSARACFERITTLSPAYADAHERLVSLHVEVGRYREALPHLRELARLRPSDAGVMSAIANAEFQCGNIEAAHETARHAQALDPKLSSVYALLAQIHFVRGELDRAAAVLEEGYALTHSGVLLGTLVHLLHRLCDWERWRAAWQLMAQKLESDEDLGSPFTLLCEDTTAEQQFAYTRRWADSRFGKGNSVSSIGSARVVPPRKDLRLRIGYFSADFQEHPAAYLLAEVLELHDRSRFEIHAYSYGPDDSSPMRARIQAAVEHFVDIAWEPDDAVVRRIRDDGIDILIDLKGYTLGDRLRIMAQQPAPIQVTWLGYPGTLGADFIDYLIADPIVIPVGEEAQYSERVVRLPHCYQANDRKRAIAQPLTRAQYGIPEDAFVFCCFNQTVKITPEIFERWMSLLRRVPRSVLWIPEDNRWSTANLLSTARSHGLDSGRIIFGPRLPFGQHLARYRVADLALDTYPYTSHTTASDGLWMGCPLVALCGQTFAARVSASVLTNCEMSDLVTQTLEQYESLAYRLATDPEYMQEVRTRLEAARETAPLFDSAQFTRDLEQLFSSMAKK